MTTDVPVNALRLGDIISLPQPAETYSDNPHDLCSPEQELSVINAWWNGRTHRTMIQCLVLHEERTIILAFDQSNMMVTRHQTTSGANIVYQDGQKVYVHWMHKTSPGIVKESVHTPDGESVYVVLTSQGTKAYVGPEDLRADTSPHPVVGQTWVCLHGDARGRTLTVTEVSENCLDVMCRRGQFGSSDSYILSSAHHGILASTAPAPVGEKGVDYDDVEMEVGSLGKKLVRVFRY